MENSGFKVNKNVRYYLLSFLSVTLALIGVIGLKLITVLVAIWIASLTEKYFGKFGLTVGFFVGLFIAGLLLKGIQRLLPYLDDFNRQIKSYKSFPYTEKYGQNYPMPKPEDFGITEAEFGDFNNRFQFEFTKIILTWGLCIGVFFYLIQSETRGIMGLLVTGSVLIVAGLLHHLFNYLNKRISQKHPHYEKINRFQRSVTIYHKVISESFDREPISLNN